jgi:hypothetical protein|tara:strand:- start:145 stop:318 length:174 start_codon:yes stop_codon:yes gene_type:complete
MTSDKKGMIGGVFFSGLSPIEIANRDRLQGTASRDADACCRPSTTDIIRFRQALQCF